MEMGESLQSMEEAISELEKSYDIQVVNSLFRSVHTIKGGAGFFELKKVQDLSHEFENILMGIREETIEFKNEMLPVFYEACDALKEMHESENYGSNLNIDSICQGLDKFKVRNDNAPLDEPLKEDIDTSKKIAPKTNEESSNDKESFPENPSKEIVSVELDQSRPGNLGKEITEEKKAGRYQEDAKKQRKAPNQNETIRVNIDLLNKLMELTGEIVLGRNQLLQQFSGSEEKSTLVAMAHMISDLQQIVLQTRMQPIGGTFTKFNRIVRELAKKLNKESLEEIHCRIGINSGPVILGNLGSEKHRLEYAMIGDNVNIGQRLESSAPKQGCMISASTYELVSEFVEVGQMQEIEVKGKKEKVKAHILEGLK